MGLMMVTNMVVFAGIAKLLMPVQSPAQIVANRGSYEKMGLLRWEDGKNQGLVTGIGIANGKMKKCKSIKK